MTAVARARYEVIKVFLENKTLQSSHTTNLTNLTAFNSSAKREIPSIIKKRNHTVMHNVQLHQARMLNTITS